MEGYRFDRALGVMDQSQSVTPMPTTTKDQPIQSGKASAVLGGGVANAPRPGFMTCAWSNVFMVN
jgi:hypothetical protein